MAGALAEALAHTIRIVAVDDDEDIIAGYEAACGLELFYTIRSAQSARAGSRLLSGTPPPHVCLLDLRLFDLDGDQLALVKRFGGRTAFLIVTASQEMQAAFDAGAMHGACGLVVKGDPGSRVDGLLRQINCCFLKWLFGLVPRGKVRSGLDESAMAFMRRFPATVEQWAACRGVSHQALAKFYAMARGVEPQHILLLARAYCHAFAEHGVLPDGVVQPPQLTPALEDSLCRDLARHKAVLDAVLRGQRTVALTLTGTAASASSLADISLRNPLSDWA